MAATSFWNITVPHVAQREVFVHTFSCAPENCVDVWASLVWSNLLQKNSKSIHLLWTTFFLKHYYTMTIGVLTIGVSERTFSAKVHFMVDMIASIISKFVSFCLFFFNSFFLTNHITDISFLQTYKSFGNPDSERYYLKTMVEFLHLL